MPNNLHITVMCQKVGCPRSILYCYECGNMKGTKKANSVSIQNDHGDSILICDWNTKRTTENATKMCDLKNI